jgi:uncharacterized membrane protein YgcG
MHDFTIRGRRPLVLAGLTILLFAASPSSTQAQDSNQPPAPAKTDPANADAAAAAKFSPEQIEQIAAPIALYPDPLVSQIFMASTYPIEVVQADRWRKANAKLSGADLDKGLKDQDWDPSVKSLCTFPEVLTRMSENLDWTQDLGDAFLGQREELMNAVQTLRKKAKDAGKLESTEQQKVVVEGDTIIVQPTNPEVIYVPSYPPTVFYGPAYAYPYYYPVMYPPPPPVATPWISFAAGVAVGAAIWSDCDWHHGDVDIDINESNNFNKNTNVNGGDKINNINKDRVQNRKDGKGGFKHDPSHRKGVNYKNPKVGQQYGAAKGSNRVSTNEARGRGNAGAGSSRPAAKPTPSAPKSAPSTPKSTQRSSSGGALNGSRNTGLDRAASSRGSQSRGNAGARGGGARSGGGRSGGGGRGGGRGGGGRR